MRRIHPTVLIWSLALLACAAAAAAAPPRALRARADAACTSPAAVKVLQDLVVSKHQGNVIFGQEYGSSDLANLGGTLAAQAKAQLNAVAHQVKALAPAVRDRWIPALRDAKAGLETAMERQLASAAAGVLATPARVPPSNVVVGHVAIPCTADGAPDALRFQPYLAIQPAAGGDAADAAAAPPPAPVPAPAPTLALGGSEAGGRFVWGKDPRPRQSPYGPMPEIVLWRNVNERLVTTPKMFYLRLRNCGRALWAGRGGACGAGGGVYLDPADG
ncbi:MAG: hypothetical protein J3K34DRAFT_274918 [Monoraphidium minutum]|nr:MAG: hypothetical protein J3K34DRAFT_274918 [Monoraphidium minutum]